MSPLELEAIRILELDPDDFRRIRVAVRADNPELSAVLERICGQMIKCLYRSETP